MANDSRTALEGGPFVVSAPFDSDPCADIVLRSSDNFEFQTRKAMLSFISPVLSDMISLEKCKTYTDTVHGSMLYIKVTETGLVFDTLLRYAYPLPNPVFDDINLLMSVFEAAEKYALVNVTSELNVMFEKMRFEHSGLLLLLYRRACDRRQEKEARKYAWDCLKLPYSLVVKNGNGASDDALPNLIDYHQSVSSEIASYIINFANFGVFCLCSQCTFYVGWEKPKWWCENLASEVRCIYEEGPISGRILMLNPDPISNELLLHARRSPNGVAKTTSRPKEKYRTHVKRPTSGCIIPPKQVLKGLCSSCEISVHKNWDSFIKTLNKEIEAQAKKIQLVLPWRSHVTRIQSYDTTPNRPMSIFDAPL